MELRSLFELLQEPVRLDDIQGESGRRQDDGQEVIRIEGDPAHQVIELLCRQADGGWTFSGHRRLGLDRQRAGLADEQARQNDNKNFLLP